MITPKEIQQQCLKWWKELLLSSIEPASYFPKEISRIGKISSKDILNKFSGYKAAIELLKDNSKEYKRFGYRLILAERQFEKIGKQPVPEKIIIESLEDYLRLTGKEKEFERFHRNYFLIMQELPILLQWIKDDPTRLISHDTWLDTLKVCKYFLENSKPGLYLRQLPIDIHTKYILENKSIVQLLLEYLIPEYINKEETRFESRFNLKYSEPLIRVKFLDKTLSPLNNVTDISLTLSEIKDFDTHCQSIFIAENLMNFLTLPCLSNTIAIWSGGGFSVSYLKNIEWLKNKQFYYWGDLDAQGFQILNQFRNYFPDTMAVMMDEETLSNFSSAPGVQAANQSLIKLSESELKLYQHLRQHNIRLEQEKITQAFAEDKIKEKFRG